MKIFHQNIEGHIPKMAAKAARYIDETLCKHGFECFLVGGSVRDLLLQRDVSDLDFTTNATPAEMKKIFPKVIPVGEEFGTVLVLYKHIPIEVTTFRTEGKYTDGRRPKHIAFGKSLKEDVMRRDFTINSMAYRFSDQTIHDYVGGKADLEAGIVKTIGTAIERFREDGLRPIRGARIMANLGFTLDPETKKAMSEALDVVEKIAPERFYDEWKKTLLIRAKQNYWNTLKETGIFKLFFPEFDGLNHDPERWSDLLSAIEHSMPRSMGVYTAHFFYFEFHTPHSLSIPEQRRVKDFISRFFKKNRFPIRSQNLCSNLVFSPLLEVFDIAQKNGGDIDSFLLKRALGKIARKEWFSHFRFCKEVIYRIYRSLIDHDPKAARAHEVMAAQTAKIIREVVRQKEAIYINDLAINGNDLKELGFQGKEIGRILQQALEHVLKRPQDNQKSVLLGVVG